MAHEINYNEHTGKHSFFSVKQKAWHNLGQIVETAPTSKEAIILAGLNFEVVKAPLFTEGSNLVQTAEGGFSVGDGVVNIPNHCATIRADNNAVLGIVGKDYEILQNVDAFDFFDNIVGESTGIHYETAGAIGQGERIFLTAKLPQYIRIGNSDDIIENYLLLTTSHDGSGSITAGFTPVRVVCQNTLNASLRQLSNVVRIRHTRGAKNRLMQAQSVFKMALNLNDALDSTFNRWAKVSITDAQVQKLIRLALSPNKETTDAILSNDTTKQNEAFSTNFVNQVDKALDYALTHDTQTMDSVQGNLFGAYNAVSGYFQNVYDFRNEETKFQSIAMNGTTQAKVQKAFNLANTYSQSGVLVL